MPEREYFRRALADFVCDAAGGDAVRHLADMGCTVKQIAEQLTFPMPCGKVREIVWKHLVDTGIVLLEEPGSGRGRTAGTYVKEYDAYGRQSFRFFPSGGPDGSGGKIVFRDVEFSCAVQEFPDYLSAKCAENGEEASYLSCDFGVCGTEVQRSGQPEAGAYDAAADSDCGGTVRQNCPAVFCLPAGGLRDYILGLPWEKRTCYHRLDRRMREIAAALYAGGEWRGTCYFLKTKEKVRMR